MDRTVLNIVSLVIGGVGLFLALVGYSAPELNKTFLGANPFASKRDAIQKVHTWSFAVFAALGVLLQIFAEILSDQLQVRVHGVTYYCVVTFIATLSASLLAFVVFKLGRRAAKRIWLPQAMIDHLDKIERCQFVLDNDGWEPEQLSKAQNYSEQERGRLLKRNEETLNSHLAQMESLLELPPDGTASQRLARISRLAPVAL